MGHVFVHEKGQKGLYIAQQTYYNIYGKEVTAPDVLKYLNDNVSVYSVERSERNCPELIPEIFGKHMTNPDAFTTEFMRVLKKEYGL